METAISRLPICILVAVLAWWLAPESKGGVVLFGLGSIGLLLILAAVSLWTCLKKPGEDFQETA